MFASFNLIRTFKSLHGWLGALILPWVIVIGLTVIQFRYIEKKVNY